jgi:hypothetical protein
VSGGIDPYSLDPDTRWKTVVSVMSQLLHPWGKSPQHLLDMRLVEPEANLGTVETGKISASYSELQSDYLVMKCLAFSLH